MTASWHQNIKRVPPEQRTVNGIVFDSVGEGRRYIDLCLLERGKAISNLRRQVRYYFAIEDRNVVFDTGIQAHYTADFVYDEDGKEVIEEYKGYDDSEARLRRAVFEAIYNVKVRVTGPAKRKPNKRSKSA